LCPQCAGALAPRHRNLLPRFDLCRKIKLPILGSAEGGSGIIVADYELGPHHLRLLEAAADAWERMTQAREVLQDEGLVVDTEHGQRKHPCVAIEHDAAIRFARLMRELDLDSEGPRPELYARPPGLRSNRR
jgi:Phage terminase, small subunit